MSSTIVGLLGFLTIIALFLAVSVWLPRFQNSITVNQSQQKVAESYKVFSALCLGKNYHSRNIVQ